MNLIEQLEGLKGKLPKQGGFLPKSVGWDKALDQAIALVKQEQAKVDHAQTKLLDGFAHPVEIVRRINNTCMKIIFGVMSGLFVGFAVVFDMPLLFSGAVVSALASIDCIINDDEEN